MRTNSAQNHGAVHVYNTSSLLEVPSFSSHIPNTRWNLLAFSPDGRRLVTGGTDLNGLRLWDIETGQPVASIGGGIPGLEYAKFSPDGKFLACTTTTNPGLHIWRAPTWEEIELVEARGEDEREPEQ